MFDSRAVARFDVFPLTFYDGKCVIEILLNDKQPQLYDLSSDPSEKTNVSKQYPDIVKELSELLESVKEK